MKPDRVIHTFQGEVHPNIQVCERGDIRFMRFGTGGGWQGATSMKRPDIPVFAYQRAFLSTLPAIQSMQRFMSLGVGTGTALRHVLLRWPEAEHFGVEIESAVVDAAIACFDSPSHHAVNYWIGDGVAFLCHTDLSFDLLFVDAYMTNAIYQPVLDPAFAHVLRASLSSTGVAVCNIITRLPVPSRVRTFVSACQEHFRTVLLAPVGPPLPMADQNALLILTDDHRFLDRWRLSIRETTALSWWERSTWASRIRNLSTRL